MNGQEQTEGKMPTPIDVLALEAKVVEHEIHIGVLEKNYSAAMTDNIQLQKALEIQLFNLRVKNEEIVALREQLQQIDQAKPVPPSDVGMVFGSQQPPEK